tara:strand:- start:944 stop:1708 length:765 start_codon:yes stop_codon:yes gene_type:complete
MKIISIFVLILLINKTLFARNVGETEITAEEGIEVFQEEKYYLLKKNVKIQSDNFMLFGDQIKIFFEDDLYDIKRIIANGSVILESSSYSISAKGDKLSLILEDEEISVEGNNSELKTDNFFMYSNNSIKINNLNGNFVLSGINSMVKNDNITIRGEFIDGLFTSKDNQKEIILLNVKDKNISYINNGKSEMFANIINYNKETSIIKLNDNVKIITDGETVMGDYGELNTASNSYKISSKNSNKVKIIITNENE